MIEKRLFPRTAHWIIAVDAAALGGYQRYKSNRWEMPRRWLDILKTIVKVFTKREMVQTFDKIDFDCTNLSNKKIWNWFLGEISFLLRTKRAWAYPTLVQIEPASGCNLRCPLCYISVHHVKNSVLSYENFKSIIDETGDYMFLLHLWGWGEPFINKDIFAMIRYARRKEIRVITSTNGHVLNADKLIDSGLDAIIIALDGVGQESYEKTRQGGDYHKVIRNTKRLVKRKKERKSPHPVVNLRMVVTRDNESQVEEMKQLAAEIGVDVLSLKTLGSHDNESLWERSLPRNHAYRRYHYDENGDPVKIKNNCKRLWNHPYIFDDGSVGHCCYALKGEAVDIPLGNVFDFGKGGFAKIWFGPNYAKTRASFIDFREENKRCGPKRCRTCNWNYVDSKNYVSHAYYLNIKCGV